MRNGLLKPQPIPQHSTHPRKAHMSNVGIKDADDSTRKIDTIQRTDGGNTVETQAVAVIDPATGTPIDFATQATLAALLVAANAIKVAAEALNTKTTAANTDAIAGTVAVSNMVAAGLTDSQLRAAAVPVSAAALPLPAGAATDASLTALAALITTLNGTIFAVDSAFVPGSPGQLMLAKRRDSDTSTVSNDGDLATLNMDEAGRLKVATQPGSIASSTGSITANGQNVSIASGRFGNLSVSMIGTSLVGHNISFEASNNTTNGTDGTWYLVQAVRSNAQTVETASGVLAATPVYMWHCNVGDYAWFRVRATAHTSGTAAYILKPGSFATEPIPAVQVTGTQPVSGTVTATVTAGTTLPVTPTQTFTNSAATTNATLTKNTAGTVWSVLATNNNAAVRFLKLYNLTVAPTVGTSVPVLTLAIPAGGFIKIDGGSNGLRFGTGISWALTTLGTDADATAVAAAEHKVAIAYT